MVQNKKGRVLRERGGGGGAIAPSAPPPPGSASDSGMEGSRNSSQRSIGATDDGSITLVNDTNIDLDMGVTIDGTFVAVQRVNAGERLNFAFVPTFYAACF